jgi:predicted PurR-regulated permease PerM
MNRTETAQHREVTTPSMRVGLSTVAKRAEVNVPAARKGPTPRRPITRGERRVTYALKILVVVALSIYLVVGVLDFFAAIRTTGLLVVGSVFFAYLIYPLVRRLNERVSVGWSITIVYVMIALFLVVAVLLVVPPLADQSQKLVQQFPAFVSKAQVELASPTNPLLLRIPLASRNYLASLPGQFGTFVQTYGVDYAQKTLTIVLSAVTVIATVIIVPVLAAYMLIDAGNVKRQVLGLFPLKHRATAEAIMDDLDKVVGGFIRGQLIDGAIVGAMIGVMLAIMHVPYALLIGVAAGILNFIPYAGAVVGFVPSVIIALLVNGPTNALIVAGLFAVIQQIDGNFVAPRVLKDNVGLSPLYIVLAILVGTELFGLAGTFLSVPVAAMFRVLREHLIPCPVSEAEAPPPLTSKPLRTARPTQYEPRNS